MNFHVPKLTSLCKTHGGKYYLSRRFVTLFPSTQIYVEACAGGLNVLLARAKVPGVREIACEIDPSIYLVWKAAIQEPRRLIDSIKDIKYLESNFESAKAFLEANDASPRWNTRGDIVRYATQYIVCNRMSRGGLMKDFAWSDRLRGKTRPKGPIPGDQNAWEVFQETGIQATCERVKDVELIYGDCLNDCLIPIFKQEKKNKYILVYLDPPYPAETRTHNGTYNYEMKMRMNEEKDVKETTHESLIKFALRYETRQYFYLSSYRNICYDQLTEFHNWYCHEFEMPNHSGQGDTKQRRIECLYTNEGIIR